jgi:hypothetical protein
MKNHLFWLLFIMTGVVLIGVTSNSASAQILSQDRSMELSASSQRTEQTPLPTVSPSLVAVDTPDLRALPPVGSNAGLVIGASVLVLIIIGAVLGSRLREKH